MVHALKQTWRVLKEDGILIDLRPRHTGQLVEVIDEEVELVTCFDDTHRENNDFAADRAIATVLEAGLFQKSRSVHFEYVTRYESGTELMAYFLARNPPVQHSDETISKICHIDSEQSAHLHYITAMQLDCYHKAKELEP